VITVRDLHAADVPAVLALERTVFPTPWTEAMLRDELRATGRIYLALVDGETLVGYGGVMVVERDAHIMTLAVSPTRQRSGLGSRLLVALVDAALVRGADHLTLEVRVSNRAARALYEKFGFVPVGVRPRYYRDEDALVMWALEVSGAEFRKTLDRLREEAA